MGRIEDQLRNIVREKKIKAIRCPGEEKKGKRVKSFLLTFK